MNLLQLKKPLVQSALVLLAIFILIGFVASAETQGFFGGIVAIFSGIFYTIVFVIGITFALLFSLLLLFAIFLGAVALYSPDSARNMYHALRSRAVILLSPWLSRLTRNVGDKQQTFRSGTSSGTAIKHPSPATPPRTSAPVHTVTVDQELRSEIAALQKDVLLLSKENQNLSQTISHLRSSADDRSLDQVFATTTALESQQRELSANLSQYVNRIEEIAAVTENNDKNAQQQSIQLREVLERIALLAGEIEELKRALYAGTATTEGSSSETVSDDGHRIFSYFEKEEERKLFADLIEEAVNKEMTYTEIDDFLSKSLPRKVDAIIKVHPSLTREYIRLRRQK